eukprot:CAMPEP_0197022378 /NCGR_PEP_ID=MMETSP1384-20130603/3289_1 /TAXON_ID=29189 /ORGANISM="Ammonia sp." /LENGTH=743 /DNA_ID=CAMNT_0042450421 /DNA_START=90 /DNA_END=2321 /DNA_ORIENTATION=+
MASERFVLLERTGTNNSNASVFEMRLNGKKLQIRHGNKGTKLAKKVIKKASVSDAIALFSDKRKQKINDGYHVVDDKNKASNGNPNHALNDAVPLSGKSIPNPNANANANTNANAKSFSFSFSQKQKQKASLAQNLTPDQQHKLDEIRQHLQRMSVSNNAESDDCYSASSGRLKHGSQPHQNRPRKGNKANEPKQKLKPPPKAGKNKKAKKGGKQDGKNKKNNQRNRPKNNRQKSYNTESSVASSMVSYEEQENNSQTANGNGHYINGSNKYEEQEEFDSAMASTEEENDEEAEETHSRNGRYKQKAKKSNVNEDEDEEEEDEEEEEEEEVEDGDEEDDEEEEEEEEEEEASESEDSAKKSSVRSGRSSDDEYEMDYEKMSNVMNEALNKKVDTSTLEWKPLKLWIRFNEYHDLKGEYAFAPQIKRIAGSCHELLVIFMRSSSFESERGVVYKRLLKLARDPEEDNKHHFETERKVCQYLTRIASTVNQQFVSRNDVCIWPVETIQFEYNGQLKWATIQPPFLPHKSTNKIFVKIEPNSGKPCVDDPVVGRYQHLFASVTRGLDLIRDWQGYGVSQDVFLNVCQKFNVQKEAVTQIKVRKHKQLQKQTQVLVVIDPVLTTYNAHYETNNPTDFGVKAIDEWKFNHDCVRCRCKYFHLLSSNITDANPDGMQFGIGDPDQVFFNMATMPKSVYQEIQRCRYDLNIWCGDEFMDQFEQTQDDSKRDDEDDAEGDNQSNQNGNGQK